MGLSHEESVRLVGEMETLLATRGSQAAENLREALVTAVERLNEAEVAALRRRDPDPGAEHGRAVHGLILRLLHQQVDGPPPPVRQEEPEAGEPGREPEEPRFEEPEREADEGSPAGIGPAPRSRREAVPGALAVRLDKLYHDVRRACWQADRRDQDDDPRALREEEHADRWQQVNMMLLRMSTERAAPYAERADEIAGVAAASPGAARVIRRPPPPIAGRSKVLLRGWPALGVPTVTTDPEGDIHPALPPTGDDRYAIRMTRLASLVLTVADHDPGLYWYRELEKPEPLHGQRADYQDLLASALIEAERADCLPYRRLFLLASVDTLLSSVVHGPPATRPSWWDDLRENSFQVVVDAGRQVTDHKIVVERYTMIHQLGENDEIVYAAVPKESDYSRRDVLACLRLEIDVDGRIEQPTKVLLRNAY
ncbi:hypothetical protein [Spongiactinospora sp. TRM90649]|uniref:hypothetical protein n=1 Tax=Spongiactinospora sp. TRM90649 TaxID=3031114 RepID=UPI0023F80C89|nr:hypothetical protein [Spongiactinospora sp. TRM90649]MDF5752647.1 hypothetical protein [Spongiactinospora sp. TRM90649]